MNFYNIIKQAEEDARAKHPNNKEERFSFENTILRQAIVRMSERLQSFQSPTQTIQIDLQGCDVDVEYTYIPEQQSSPVDPPFASSVHVEQVYIRGSVITHILTDRQITYIENQIIERLNT